MEQVKFTLHKAQLDFVKGHKTHGYKDRSSMVRAALDRLRASMDEKRLHESAALYAQEYASDSELEEITEQALTEWPSDEN
jgi:Arc/MetJ-type ribon-helix-helix transcriptional regulator